jgi:hypothetical protein
MNCRAAGRQVTNDDLFPFVNRISSTCLPVGKVAIRYFLFILHYSYHEFVKGEIEEGKRTDPVG